MISKSSFSTNLSSAWVFYLSYSILLSISSDFYFIICISIPLIFYSKSYSLLLDMTLSVSLSPWFLSGLCSSSWSINSNSTVLEFKYGFHFVDAPILCISWESLLIFSIMIILSSLFSASTDFLELVKSPSITVNSLKSFEAFDYFDIYFSY